MAAPCAPWHCMRGPVRSGGCGRPLNTIVSWQWDPSTAARNASDGSRSSFRSDGPLSTLPLMRLWPQSWPPRLWLAVSSQSLRGLDYLVAVDSPGFLLPVRSWGCSLIAIYREMFVDTIASRVTRRGGETSYESEAVQRKSRTLPANNALDRTVGYRGRAVLSRYPA